MFTKVVLPVLLIMAVTGTFIPVSAAGAAPDQSPAQAQAELALREFDYLPGFLAMPQRRPEGGALNLWFYQQYPDQFTDHAGQELSPAEQRLFSEFLLDENLYISFDRTILQVLECWNDTGRIPADGLELLRWQTGGPVSDRRTDELFGSGEAVSPVDYLRLYPTASCVVNPATGKYIDSFQATEWTPLGICISEVEEIPEHYYSTDRDGNRFLPEGFSILPVKLYGEDEGEVIYDHAMTAWEKPEWTHE